jgi:hypothetical protein
MMYSDLEHSGVLGMKWGHKKGAGWSNNSAGKQHVAIVGKKLLKNGTAKPQPRPYTRPKDMPPKRLTDAQLKSRINRIEMEKKYASLTKQETSREKKMIMDVLSTAIKTTATAYVTKMMGKGMDQFMMPKNTSTPSPHIPTPHAPPTPPPAPRVRRNIRMRRG